MNTAIYYGILLLLAVVLILCQHFIPPLELFQGARVNLLPALIAFVALALDFPWALGYAFFVGLFWDAMTIPYVDGEPEMSFGLTILFFGIATIIIHGCRGWFRQGRLYLHPILSALLAILWVGLQYLLVSLKRKGFYFDESVIWRLGFPGVLNLCLAPLLLWVLWTVGTSFGLELREKKTRRRYSTWVT